jgi:hypothetical protein
MEEAGTEDDAWRWPVRGGREYSARRPGEPTAPERVLAT